MTFKLLSTLALTYLVFSGCGLYKAVEVGNEKGFVHFKPPSSEGIISDKMPFMYVWSDLEYNFHREKVKERGRYKLYIAPIGTHYLELSTMEEWFQDDVVDLQVFFHDTIEEEIRKNLSGSLRVELTNIREEADYAFECEITELSLGNPIVYVGTWLIPIPGIATAVDASTTPIVAIEARLVDVEFNRVVAELYDRKIPKIRILDLRKVVSMTSPVREVMRDWSIELARAFTFRADIDESVEGTSEFSLIPW